MEKGPEGFQAEPASPEATKEGGETEEKPVIKTEEGEGLVTTYFFLDFTFCCANKSRVHQLSKSLYGKRRPHYHLKYFMRAFE